VSIHSKTVGDGACQLGDQVVSDRVPDKVGVAPGADRLHNPAFGGALTIADTNANNVFGISEDRAQLSGSCSKQPTG